jgi:hypothetical protein
MASGAQSQEDWFVEVGWGLPECSWHWGGQCLRRFLESVPWGAGFTLLLRLLESVLLGAVLSWRCSGSWRLSRGIGSPPGLDIWWRVDCSDTYGPVLSCQTFNVAASRGPDSGGVYLVLEALGRSCQEPGRVLSWVTRLGHNRCPMVP